MSDNYFNTFRTGTLFLIRTPDTFPVGYAERCLADMERLHFDYIAWLETWNCMDGIVWPHPDYPRSSYWKGETRDPLEEVFEAADRHGLAFLPEAGVMHDGFMLAHPEDMIHHYDGTPGGRYGRIGLVPASPLTSDFFIAKYDALLEKYQSHPSCRGICMPCENGIGLTYDRHTREAWKKAFSCPMPSPEEIYRSRTLQDQVSCFLEDVFLNMYRKLARHLKQKYRLPLMHYPLSKVSAISHMQGPSDIDPPRNLSVMCRIKELNLLNLQLHPPLSDNILHFKLEVELLQGLCKTLPNVADTHFYHESCSGKLPEATPKRYIDYVLSTLTPFGISFFCYGFFAPELPLWKKELNPGAKVFNGYSQPEIVARRRENVVKALGFAEQLRPLLSGTFHRAECAIYWTEDFDRDYLYGSYYRDHLFGLYELCQSAALPTMIATEIPAAADRIKLLIFHSVRSFSEENRNALARFLQNGGKALVIGNCCNELLQTCGLDVERTEATFVKDSTLSKYNDWSFTPPSDSYRFTEKNGEALYRYDTGEPAVTRLNNVVYFGASGSISSFPNARSRNVNLVPLWKKLLAELGGHSGVTVTASYLKSPDGHIYLSADLYETPERKRRILLLRNFGVEIKQTILDWKLPGHYQITQAIADGKEFIFSPGAVLPEFEHFIALQAE